MKDLHNIINPLLAIAPVSVADTTVTTSGAIDLQGYNACEFVLLTGSLADADATFTVEVDECDTSGGSYTAVADSDLIGTEALASFVFSDDNKTRKIGYIGSKRFVKISITPAANASAALIAAVAILGVPCVAPTANPPA